MIDPAPATRFGGWNWAVLAVYLAAMLLIGWRMSRRQQSAEDFFLAGRCLPWWAVAMSMYASVTSATTFLGLPGMAYADNVSLVWVGLISPLVAPLLVFLFYPFYRRDGLSTSYGYIGRRFGDPARRVVSALFLLARLGWLGLVVYAPALAISTATGLRIETAILIIGLLTTAYTVMGGLGAVVWTDVAQFVIMLGGLALVLVEITGRVPGGAAAIFRTACDAGRMNLFDVRIDLAVMNTAAVAVAYFFLLMQDYGVDQVTVQRLLAVRSNRGVAKAVLFNAGTDTVALASLLFAGLGLLAFYGAYPDRLPGGIRPDAILPFFVIRELPAGVSGLIIAAILAAAMSSMDSGITSMSGVIVQDFIEPLRGRPIDDRSAVRLARVLTAGMGVAATLLAFAVISLGGIIRSFYAFMGLFSAPVLALFLLGMLTRRARFEGWLMAMILSVAGTLAIQRSGLVHEIYFFPLAALFTFTAGWTLSWIWPARIPPAGWTIYDRPRIRVFSAGD